MKPTAYFAGGAVVACALFAGAANAATSCDKTPVKPRSVEAIGRDMVVNGVPTSLVGMQFDGTVDDVSKAFREFWIAENAPAKGRSTASGLMLSAVDGNCLYLLSLPPQQDGARTRGLMTVAVLGRNRAEHRIPDSAIPLPEESKVLSDVESRDGAQTGRTWLIDVPGEARWNAQRYRNLLALQGWANVGRQPDYVSVGIQSPQGKALVMQRGKDSVDASFSDRDGRTVAVINATRNR
ncbi:hypothetical protein LMG22037_00928 [Paraburkholderia phenoliruptrix]|uniref:Lipoprotein n=1 Tax=Paraburkholderia phenoliruptrix TaxID=252970 RepID=A0A6J5A3N0_9BURK|nr:hypothetical protein [Paraburkholderia phenoliruptrix]CAB3649830.1 hypothetical protein LMG22037_00928 [Paraburkholderia phenoliruptrix]